MLPQLTSPALYHPDPPLEAPPMGPRPNSLCTAQPVLTPFMRISYAAGPGCAKGSRTASPSPPLTYLMPTHRSQWAKRKRGGVFFSNASCVLPIRSSNTLAPLTSHSHFSFPLQARSLAQKKVFLVDISLPDSSSSLPPPHL